MVINNILYNTYKELTVHKEPDEKSEVLFKIQPKSTIMIDRENSTSEWSHIITPIGAEGYCRGIFKEGQVNG